MNTITNVIHFITDPQNTFATHSADFIRYCVISSLLAIAIAVPIGLLVAQQRAVAFIFNNVTGLVRAIPTLAFFALTINTLGFGSKPVIVALTILGIPPILLNTIVGIRAIDPAIIDAAQGMGMTRLQILQRIEIPLLLPLLAAGVRNGVVQIIATAPIAAIIGGGGYGEYILSGVSLIDPTQILAGAIPVAVLALGAELGLGALQRWVTPKGIRARTQGSQDDIDAPAQAGNVAAA